MAADSMALVRKRTDTELMPPPPPAKKIKRPKTVLDEESYTEGLSRIIARDFFPGLVESETQQEYLDALESEDKQWIAIASRRLQDAMAPGRRTETPGQTPARTPVGRGSVTPSSTSSRSGQVDAEHRPTVKTNMSLTAFQAKHTSEDNESFYKLLDRQNQKKVEARAWAWNGNKLPSKQMIAQKKVEDQLSLTRSIVDDGLKKDRLAIRDRVHRPAQPDTWAHTAKNNLMFTPDGVEDDIETIAQVAEAQSKMGPKTINYHNTRMPQPTIPPRPPSPTMSAVRDAVAGKTRRDDGDSVVTGGETPRVNGYAFVDDEDDEPEELGAVPVINLGPGDATPNPFKLAESRKRESLHHKLVDKISESKKTASRFGMTGKPDKTPTPKYPHTPRVSGGLTPAAQRLWNNVGNSKSRTPASAFGGFGGETPSRSRATNNKGGKM